VRAARRNDRSAAKFPQLAGKSWKTNFIEQGRKVKETAGGMFYDPAALVAFIRFNFLLRRTLLS